MLTLRRSLVFLPTVFLLASLSQASADQFSGPFTFPGDRYIGAPGVNGSLAYWKDQIVPTIIGGKDQTRSVLESVASLLFYARTAGVQVKVGDKGISNTSDGQAFQGSNYVIAITDKMAVAIGEEVGRAPHPTLAELGVDLSLADANLQEISRQGLIKQGDGCYARWQVNSEQHVKAIAIAVDSGLSEEAKTDCVSQMVVSSLGVYPVVNKYHIKFGNSEKSRAFSNDGEMIMELEASNYCRKEWSQYTSFCPRSVINSILSLGSSLSAK